MLWQTVQRHVLWRRRFFAYHLNVRHPASDYLFQAGRLFQEWILNGWITCQNQRLSYHRHNQKALRADTYKNLQDAVAQRAQGQESEGGNVYPRIMTVAMFPVLRLTRYKVTRYCNAVIFALTHDVTQFFSPFGNAVIVTPVCAVRYNCVSP